MFQVLNVSPEHPAVLLSLRQVQCQQFLAASKGTFLPDTVLEQLNSAVMANPTNLGAWHVSWPLALLKKKKTHIMVAHQQSQTHHLLVDIFNCSHDFFPLFSKGEELKMTNLNRWRFSNKGSQIETLFAGVMKYSYPLSLFGFFSSPTFILRLATLPWPPFPQWLAEVYKGQGLFVQGVMAYKQSLQLASQLGVHHSQVASLLRLALLALGPCMVSSWTANQLRKDWEFEEACF